MSTEYRPGIPSHAHIEAAERLGLEWEDLEWEDDDGDWPSRWRLAIRSGSVISDFATSPRFDDWDNELSTRYDHVGYSFRPIHPDGTPVDWETLDAEVARVAGAAGSAQQGFRADLWRRICAHFTGREVCDMVSFDQIVSLNDTACHFTQWYWDWRDMPAKEASRTDILARWAVYQELKPLYDLVDGAQGEAAMPRDVIRAWWDRAPPTDCGNDHCPWSLHREATGLVAQGPYRIHAGNARGAALRNALRNFATVLDAVAERRVAERMQTQAPTVMSAHPEPRRFADVRPDRHGWRWWRTSGSSVWGDNTRIEIQNTQFRVHLENLWQPWAQFALQHWLPTDRTVIPTDEQGNPVSWDSIGPTDPTEIRLSSPQEGSTVDFEQGVDRANRAITQALVAPLGPPPVGEMTRGLANYDGPVLTIDSVSCEGASGWVTLPGLHDSMRALPRFGLIELDDDDRTGQSRQAPGPTLRSGTIPTAAQVAKFRGALSRKLDNTLADAAKESGVSCEVSQYIIQRWAGGLGDEEAAEMVGLILRSGTSAMSVAAVDERARAILASWSPKFADRAGPARSPGG
ncbi:MAG: hypothetical protein E6Q97_11885 [Desulfurellales bacterium]|nr:MAG: hypothetical protein E6Q97_11885 [Desulfurellales bacterium]